MVKPFCLHIINQDVHGYHALKSWYDVVENDNGVDGRILLCTLIQAKYVANMMK